MSEYKNTSQWLATSKMSQALPESSTYQKDMNLFVWDCICNCVASIGKQSFHSLCSNSYMNMTHSDTAKALFGKYKNSTLFALQEFPQLDTPKGVAYVEYLQNEGYQVYYDNGNAFVVRSHIRAENTPLTPETLTGIMNDVLQQYNIQDSKIRKGFLETTVSRTQVLLIGNVLCVNIHAKNPKEHAVCLADYIGRLCKYAPVAGDYIVFSDTNIEAEKQLIGFQHHLLHYGVHKTSNDITTSKHRSLLHGQTYNTNKCHRTVQASKDHICASSPIETCLVQPSLKDASITLPSVEHPSDHSAVVAVVKVSGGRHITVSTLNICGGGDNPVEFKELNNPHFMQHCNYLEQIAQSLTKQDVLPYFQHILSSPNMNKEQRQSLEIFLGSAQDHVWSWFTEDMLKNDNKLHHQRINLLTKAFQLHNRRFMQ